MKSTLRSSLRPLSALLVSQNAANVHNSSQQYDLMLTFYPFNTEICKDTREWNKNRRDDEAIFPNLTDSVVWSQ